MSRLVAVGVILGAHGVRGDVRVKSFTDEPEACFAYGPLLDAEGRRLFVARTWRPAKSHFIVAPTETREKEDWDALRGALVHVPSEALPEPVDDEGLYVEDFVGLAAFDTSGSMLGEVIAVHDFGAGDILEIALADGGAAMVPFNETEAPVVDVDAGRIILSDLAAWTGGEGES